MTIVRTRTPSGEAIVILPEAEFERLCELAEDATDIRGIETSRSRVAAGDDDLLDEADLDRLRSAVTPLAFWRERRAVTAASLAGAAGVDEDVLKAVEAGGITNDIDLYRRLAEALDVDVEDLAPGPEAA